jgi:hypothetical protein
MAHIIKSRVAVCLSLLVTVGIVGGCFSHRREPGKSTVTLTATVPTSALRNAPTEEFSLSYDCDCFVSSLNTSPLANRVLRTDAWRIVGQSKDHPMDQNEIVIWIGGSNDPELEKAIVKYRCYHAGFGFEACRK